MARPRLRSAFAALGVAAALCLPACATMNQADAQEEGPAVLGGCRYAIGQFGEDHASAGDLLMVALDLPLSFGLDLVVLPFTVANEIYHGGIYVDPVRPAIERRGDEKKPRSY